MAMGLIGHALTGAVKGAAEGGIYVLKQQMEEEKALRIAEFNSQLRRSDSAWSMDEQERRNTAKIGRVEDRAKSIANERGQGLINSATGAYESLKAKDPEGARLGLEAVEKAKQSGGYDQPVTLKDRAAASMMESGDAKGMYQMEVSDEQAGYQRGRDAVGDERWQKEFAQKGAQLAQSAKLAAVQYDAAKLAYDRASAEAKIPVAVDRQYKSLDVRLKEISKSIYDAKAKGEFNTEAGAELISEQTRIAGEMSKLMAPYMPTGENGLPAGAKVRDFSSLGNGSANSATTKTADAASLPTGQVNRAESASKQSVYETELKKLNQMKSGFLPTPDGSKDAIRRQEAYVDQLYKGLYK